MNKGYLLTHLHTFFTYTAHEYTQDHSGDIQFSEEQVKILATFFAHTGLYIHVDDRKEL